MTCDERIEALLARGYFPKELPPPFTSAAFANNLANIVPLWTAYESGLSQQQRRTYPPPSNYTRFDLARKGHSRRILGVPNPVNMYFLAKDIADHQDEFESVLATSRISITPVEIKAGGKRAVDIPSLSVLTENRISAYATARAILQTDVLSFYHAIYTHSFPWALHGKRVAKRNRSVTDPTVYGNRIDALLRACQDGQTVGIPVGPDTSRIISELIMCAVERKIGSEHFDRIVGGYRYIDDFFLCFASHVDAEAFLAALREAVLNFDLQLNASKTRIIGALEFNEESWPSEIAQLKLGRSGDQRRNLIRFFTEVIRLSKSLPDESISSFAVRKTSRTLIERANWDIYEPFLIRLARENSNCLESVVKIFCTYAAAGYPMSGRIQGFAEGMIEEHAPYNHHYEVVWILWLCRSLSIRLGERSTHLAARMENSLCGCLLQMLRSRRLLTGRGTVSDWTGRVDQTDLQGEHWLLVYEAGIRRSWGLPGAAEAVDADPHFRVLRDQQISFFNASATNVALELPTISHLLQTNLGHRRSAVLPGAIRFASSVPRHQRRYEKLGEDYGSDDSGWSPFYRESDEDFDELTCH